jgi:hypothetical protein
MRSNFSEKILGRKAASKQQSLASQKQGDQIGQIFAFWVIVYFG